MLFIVIKQKVFFNDQQGVLINFAVTLVLITIFEEFCHQYNAKDMLFRHMLRPQQVA